MSCMKPENNADGREDATTVAERLYYEGVVQELGRDCDLLYVCPSNSALAHLPYLVALDNATQCAPHVCMRLNTRSPRFKGCAALAVDTQRSAEHGRNKR